MVGEQAMTRRRAMFHVKQSRLIMDFDLASAVQKGMADALLDGGRYEEATSAFMERTIKPGDTVIDVGAHVGYFSLLMAALVGPSGRVLAFEPNPENYQRLLSHLAINGLTNVTPFHMAVGDKCGVVDLWINKDNDGGHAVYDVGQLQPNTKSRAHPQRYPVWMTTLDAICQTPTCIKIDVEGNEHNVMRGCGSRPSAVISEIHRPGLVFTGSSEDKYRSYMASRGYCTSVPDFDGALVNIDGKSVQDNVVFNVVFTERP
jgi:FkbM family methyltransferase